MKILENFQARPIFRGLFSVLLACSGFVAMLPVWADDTAPAQITVDAGTSPGPVSPFVLGQAIENADGAGVFRGSVTQPLTLATGDGFWDPVAKQPVAAIVEKCRQINVGMLRYPGGSLANNYNWKKAVGPLSTRGDWKCGLDEYLAICRAIRAEPLITVSDYVLPADRMPQMNAELVEYLNAPATPDHPWAEKRKEWGHEQPFGVKWFELGNESDNGNCDLKPHRQFTAEQYAAYAIACAHAMKAVDPSIKVGVVTAVSTSDPDSEWNKKVLRLTSSIADFTIVHQYSPGMGPSMPIEDEPKLMQSCMAEADQYEKLLQDYSQVIHDESGRTMPIAVTEYNAGFILDNPKPYRFSYGAALDCADLIRVFLKPENHVLMANYWQLLNGYWGMLKSQLEIPDGGQIVEKPAFPLYRLWGEHFGTSLVDVKVAGLTQSFPGFGTVLPAQGHACQRAAPAGVATVMPANDPSTLKGNGYTVRWTGPASLRVDFDQWTGSAYPVLGTVRALAGKAISDCDYKLEFDARYTPKSEPGTEVNPVGLEISDSRGWDKTGSIAQVKTVAGPEWHHFSSDLFLTLPDAAGLTFSGIFDVGIHKIAGTMEVRDLKLSAFSRTTFPEYSLLTSAASLSPQKDKLYVIVFNKSVDRDLPAQINVQGFSASSAKLWQVNAPSLGDVDHSSEVQSGVELGIDQNRLTYTFPAHSMTAIEVSHP